MRRRARDVFAMHANALEVDVVRSLHGELAKDVQFAERTVEEKIEVHHHAARAGDLTRVRETADFFGLELRALATKISVVEHDYEGAAKLFRDLVEQFDKTDAYAWEYLGFNLARADKKAKQVRKHDDEILRAYREAHTLDKKNPLYHAEPDGDERGDAHVVRERVHLHLEALHVGAELVGDALGRLVGVLAHERDGLLGEHLELRGDLFAFGLRPLLEGVPGETSPITMPMTAYQVPVEMSVARPS
jgi:hypothetical protein